ncbi:O-acetylhomoserine aminocarboxypropyltransferase/cysteine synthase family protein [Azospira inquinata]|uniref:O-acetylhomoserine aminocarboxypropyltransferase/cysteine synthase n=1 Tax=Azospira inquinata TaxID=2785627 RepID=A0A975SKE1_9RHOO|nr:PLP-dependent transferase [Azospira inquinata]QWT46723.1 O-acetylhomoserine aminocarboxypropyltransferase/cysteine synthase [Azospira inquinata]QWT47953.1 O-acetylhomoserine aminocarboxypropyltransferase/cysteine synthase [Azospira inquinata]
MDTAFSQGTLCVQGGYTPRVGEPRIPPIVQSTTYRYDDLEQLHRLMTLQEFGFKYSRTGNPTVSAFEQRVNLLEGGVAAVATASGQAANALVMTNLLHAGDHVVAAATLYGGSFSLLHNTLPKFGISTSFFNPEAPAEEIARLFRPNTRVLFGETIGNPGLNILDFDKLAGLSRRFDVPFVVDNTLASPVLCNPFRHGAHIVTHSASKYMDGHGTSIGGVVVEGGGYAWDKGKFPDFTEPDESYGGVRYAQDFPQSPFIIKARAHMLRDFGACLNPQNAFLFTVGLETLPLRLEAHSRNALALAEFLSAREEVSWVNYPGLSVPGRERLGRYFNQPWGGGVLTFGLRGDFAAINRFVKRLKLTTLAVHVGDARTYVLHPASTTHAQLDEAQLALAGISRDMIRVSLGIETTADILADFAQALSAKE